MDMEVESLQAAFLASLIPGAARPRYGWTAHMEMATMFGDSSPHCMLMALSLE